MDGNWAILGGVLFVLACGLILFLVLRRPKPSPPGSVSSPSPVSRCRSLLGSAAPDNDLQALVDGTPSGGVLRLTQDFGLPGTVQISRPMTLDGQGHTLVLSPSAGTVPALLVFDLSPSDVCKLTCAEWGTAWTAAPKLSGVTLQNLKVRGNLGAQEKSSQDYILRDTYCARCSKSMSLSGGLARSEANLACATYADLETVTSFDALGLAGVSVKDVGSKASASGSECQACGLAGRSCASPPAAPCASLRASTVTVVHTSDVTLRNVEASAGRSAAISAFFGCTKLLLDSCAMHGSRYDGFGPDSLRDGVIRNCTFGSDSERNAAISVSAGAGDARGPNW